MRYYSDVCVRRLFSFTVETNDVRPLVPLSFCKTQSHSPGSVDTGGAEPIGHAHSHIQTIEGGVKADLWFFRCDSWFGHRLRCFRIKKIKTG